MALKIIWSAKAKNGLSKVIEYLQREWTQREITNLGENITSTLSAISSSPEIFPKSLVKSSYKALVDKNNYLIYSIDLKKSCINIINFRGTKQKPKY